MSFNIGLDIAIDIALELHALRISFLPIFIYFFSDFVSFNIGLDIAWTWN